MSEKKDSGHWYQPKLIQVRAVQWTGQKHPLVKESCNCGKGCELCVAKVPVLENRGGRAAIATGDYIIGPDAQGLVHVFSQKEFDQAYELLQAAPGSVTIKQSKWLQSTYAINCMQGLFHWLRTNKESRWAQSNPGAQQEMHEHTKFVEQHLEAMERSRRGE